jgi:hypothetical protein
LSQPLRFVSLSVCFVQHIYSPWWNAEIWFALNCVCYELCMIDFLIIFIFYYYIYSIVYFFNKNTNWYLKHAKRGKNCTLTPKKPQRCNILCVIWDHSHSFCCLVFCYYDEKVYCLLVFLIWWESRFCITYIRAYILYLLNVVIIRFACILLWSTDTPQIKRVLVSDMHGIGHRHLCLYWIM